MAVTAQVPGAGGGGVSAVRVMPTISALAGLEFLLSSLHGPVKGIK